jgi:hypothetical protein
LLLAGGQKIWGWGQTNLGLYTDWAPGTWPNNKIPIGHPISAV